MHLMKCGSVKSTMSMRLASWSLNSEETVYFFFFPPAFCSFSSAVPSTSRYLGSLRNRPAMNVFWLLPMHSMRSLLSWSLFLSRKESVQ